MKKSNTQQPVACFKKWSRKSYSAFSSLKKQVTIGVLWVGMSLISLAGNVAYAQTSDTTTLVKVVELQDVGVTHSKGNPTRSATLPTPIFSRKDETNAPLQTLESVLRLSPSIDVRERSGKGAQADISIRGGSFDQTQVMLNGINFTSARTGHVTHTLPIDIESIAGIELIDGVSGVGAYAGAINIRTAPLATDYVRLDMSGGAYGYGYGNLSGSYTKGRFNIFGAGSYRRSDGYAYNTEFENWNGYVRSTYDSERFGFFDAQVGFQKRDFGANGFYSLSYPDQYQATKTALSSLRWVKEFGSNITLNSSVSYRKGFDHYELIRYSSVGENFHNTDDIGAELYLDYKWSEAGVSTIGADYTYNHIWSTSLGNEVAEPNGKYTKADSRNIGNYYIRHNKEWQRYGVSASAGLSNTPYGVSPIWSVSGRYRPARGLVVEAGANESMRLPTFTDLYYNNATRIADPNLQPEQAITYRLASSFKRNRWSTNAQLYLRDGDNIIDWAQSPEENAIDPDCYYSRQITSLKTYGVEWSGAYAPEGFVERISVSYGYITQDKDSGDMISLYAQNYLQNKAALSLSLNPIRNITVVLTTSLYDRIGNYQDATGTTVAYEPYMLLDSRVTWERKKLRVYVDVTNITSTDYYDYGGLEMPGCWASAGLSITL
ncbi:MAG: TonB-dependent receptor [Rikenellaceae bacterium]